MKTLPLTSKEYEKLHRDFYKAIIGQGYSGGDHAAYPRHVREFLFFLETKKVLDLKEIKVEHVISYYEYLIERPNLKSGMGLSISYVRQHITAIGHFFTYLLKTKHIDSIPVTLPRFSYTGAKERYVPSEAEIKILYDAAKNKIERAILSCAYGCGLRKEEIGKLNVNDIAFSSGVINVRRGKNNRSRSVSMAQGVMTDLREYLVHERPKKIKQGHKAPEAFFLSHFGGRLGGYMLNLKITDLVKRTSLKGKPITLHCLRHAIATHMIDRGATMNTARRFLGHTLLDTTQIYTRRRKQRTKLYQMFEEHMAEHNPTGK